ncbi:MAG: endo-1,4-beta-xylanase [Candidatus Staskawiczbacteria bacterium]|nr:endo-1,4-beta-xylanase [Candidatus Staskawiczbacteria bacterium]
MKRIKIFLAFLALFFALFLAVFFYLFVGKAPKQENIVFGVNFSQKGAESLRIDWKEIYLAVLDDLKIKKLKLLTHWDLVEKEEGIYYFDDLDWQVEQAEQRGVKLIFVLGIKTGRWPECHDPEWAGNLTLEKEQEELMEYIKGMVLRYKYSSAIYAWQVENEPLVNFGECPWRDKYFWKKEIELVKSIDDSRPVVASDSGENSFWFSAAKNGDIVGITIYRKVWGHITDSLGFYINLPYSPVYYWRKAQLIKKIFNKEVISTELQAEPWGPVPFYNLSLKEQEKSMNEAVFKRNIEYARRTGLKEFYLWGAEWWYWMKETQNKPQIWNEAKNLF